MCAMLRATTVHAADVQQVACMLEGVEGGMLVRATVTAPSCCAAAQRRRGGDHRRAEVLRREEGAAQGFQVRGGRDEGRSARCGGRPHPPPARLHREVEPPCRLLMRRFIHSYSRIYRVCRLFKPCHADYLVKTLNPDDFQSYRTIFWPPLLNEKLFHERDP